jgi:cytochrome c biogenesis protein CcmG, thiol:disulfide interchange protein DsbE
VGLAVTLVVVVGAITWVAVAGGDDGGSGASTVEPTDVRAGGPRAGDVAPDFTAQTLDGKTVRLSDFRGQPVVLNFWASWCNPCRKEFPLFRQQLAAHKGEFVMLGVNYRDIASDARAFVKEQRATWRTADDSTNAIVKAYGITGVPQTFFIRPDGTIAVRYYSDIPDAADFRTALTKVTKPSST